MEVTAQGHADLQQKLQQLQQQIKLAEQRVLHGRTFCDFSDDPTYQQAFDDYVMLREQAQELAYLLETATIVQATSEVIGLGAVVTFREGTGELETYQLVTALEADVVTGKISIQSPMAQALLGKRAGDEVEVNGSKITIIKASVS